MKKVGFGQGDSLGVLNSSEEPMMGIILEGQSTPSKSPLRLQVPGGAVSLEGMADLRGML